MKKILATLSFLTLISTVAFAQSETIFTIRIENVGQTFPVLKNGVFNTPVGTSAPAPIGPGQSYEFDFSAPPGTFLSFATMFVQSNDLFYAPMPGGIALYDENGMPVTGSLTSQIYLWDAGTEVDEEPSVGLNQAPRQSGANTGMDENGVITLISDGEMNDGFAYPNVADVLSVTLESTGPTGFQLRIENVSDDNTLQTSTGSVAVPLAPGPFAVHASDYLLFEDGLAASLGLEDIAEDGNPTIMHETISGISGVTVPLAPGAFAVHDAGFQLFSEGQAVSLGLENIAEDGNPTMTVSDLMGSGMVSSSGAFNTPVGASTPSPIFPGQTYEFEISASAGDRLSFATMFVQSNDLFYAPMPEGIALFDGNGLPISGELTSLVYFWDAGTEVDEEPGVGLN